MDIALGTLLLAGKWVFIAIVYGVLFIVLKTVRREMSQRLERSAPVSSAVPGHLRVVAGGSDPRLASDALDAVPFLISLEVRRSAVGRRADVVFPVAPVVEKPGSFVDWEAI